MHFGKESQLVISGVLSRGAADLIGNIFEGRYFFTIWKKKLCIFFRITYLILHILLFIYFFYWLKNYINYSIIINKTSYKIIFKL